jgi:hypothetical protein
MNVFKSNGLSKKEEQEVFGLLQEISDPYQEGYITHNNLRLFIRENFDIFKSDLKKGDKIIFNENGLLSVVGFSDNGPRKFLKVLVKDLSVVPSLVKKMYWHVKTDIFAKVKENNPLKDVLLRNGFRFLGSRGREVLLVHQYVARPEPQYKFVKDQDED